MREGSKQDCWLGCQGLCEVGDTLLSTVAGSGEAVSFCSSAVLLQVEVGQAPGSPKFGQDLDPVHPSLCGYHISAA